MRESVFTFAAVLFTLLATVSMAHSVTDLNLVLSLLFVVWLLPQSGARGAVLVAVLILFMVILPLQPLCLSVATLMAYPMLSILFSPSASSNLRLALFIPWIAMPSAVMVLQSEGAIGGSAWLTFGQFLAVSTIALLCQGWKGGQGNTTALLVVAIPLSVWLPMQTLAVMSVIGVISAIQMLQQQQSRQMLYRLTWLLPTLPFAALTLYQVEHVSMPILMMWLILLLIELMGESLLADFEQENIT
ncbi:MAG: hypothetical protein ACRC55_03185 [Plesiomonas sp.]